jgi:L-lactate dehydrogenase (cytochrome)
LEKHLPPEKHLGKLREDAREILDLRRTSRKKSADELRVEEAQRAKPPLNRILSLRDLETVARAVLSYKALTYYSSAADDEISLHLFLFVF